MKQELTVDYLLNLIRKYFYALDVCDKYYPYFEDIPDVTPWERIDEDRIKYGKELRKLVLSDKDKKLIREARAILDITNWGAGVELIKQCDSTAAMDEINNIMARLAHREEAKGGTI